VVTCSNVDNKGESENYISLKYRTPVGGEDVAAIKEAISLRFADGDEHFVTLGCVDEEPIEKGEVVYTSGKEVLCSKWNWRESDRTKLTENTKNVILVIDALPPLQQEERREIRCRSIPPSYPNLVMQRQQLSFYPQRTTGQHGSLRRSQRILVEQ
jgi:DNA/RNA-binding domain of Phe-tRNA-synthetase-like protein